MSLDIAKWLGGSISLGESWPEWGSILYSGALLPFPRGALGLNQPLPVLCNLGIGGPTVECWLSHFSHL